MKHILFLLSILFCLTNGKAQSNDKNSHYVDINNNSITKAEFEKQCKTSVLKCQKYEKDSTTLYKINQRYKFGKLKSDDYQQIRNLLSLDSKLNINDNEVIVLSYQDTLFDYNKAIKYSKKHYKSHLNDTTFSSQKYSKKDFVESRKRYVKSKLKCVEKFEKKYQTKIVYVYKNGDNIKASYGALNMFKDRGLIKRLFFKNNNEFYLLVLKPNGDFFLNGGHLSDKDLGKLIKDNDWTTYKAQLKTALTEKKINGFGIFKTPNEYHKKHCF